jgi:pantoate--beta-alanine ligase
MKVYKKKSELTAYLDAFRGIKSTGFVPTMGALHSGHLRLIEESKKDCEITICSIFVNPKQFNNYDDYANYPNNLNKDLEKLKKLNCDIVYTPKINDLYANEEKVKEFDFGPLANIMEGKFRPGHFNGMATVIEKFFNIINPTKAFFGQKDLQQLQIVKALVHQMNIPIEIKGTPTVREENGLAKSSRNELLSANAKDEATLIYKCLNYCLNNKEKGVRALKLYIQNQFKKQDTLELEYAEITSLKNLLPISKWEAENENAICIAAYIDSVRLIDNIIL